MRVLVTGGTGKLGNAVARRLAERGAEAVINCMLATYPKGTAYERSKQRAEELVLGEGRHGIEVVIVNPSTVYGPGPWHGTGVDGVLRDAIRGRLPALPPGGMTLAFVDDLAEAHLAALDRGRLGERYLLANGFATTREICQAAVDSAGRGRVPRTLPVPIAKGLGIPRTEAGSV